MMIMQIHEQKEQNGFIKTINNKKYYFFIINSRYYSLVRNSNKYLLAVFRDHKLKKNLYLIS